jgi:2-dehydro-3-deoxyphosphogluconate aldolase/(4S)-4-hydroxy-2-oxoglutarate aldolase
MIRLANTKGPSLNALSHQAPVIPQLTISDIGHAVPLAEALVAAGLPVLEISVRTGAALAAIELIARVPGASPGAGNVLAASEAAAAKKAGAQFASAPGSTHLLLDACEDMGLPVLPGASTATEAMRLLERGFALQSFYPAEASGGAGTLARFAKALPQVHFRPCGGVTLHKAAEYLQLPNVPCVAGSWMVPPALQDGEHWSEIRGLAHQARLSASGTGL